MGKIQKSEALDYSRITFTGPEIKHARGVVAASSNDAQDATLLLETLGLMPDSEEWFHGSEE